MAAKTTTPKNDAPEPTEDIDPGPLSFSVIKPEEMLKTGGRAGAPADTRFDEVLKQSFETESPIEFTVPEGAAKKTMTALRSAANRLNLGVKVRHATQNGQTTIQFLSREKNWRKAPGTANESADSGDNADTNGE